jgi:teichuronic acid biosynthesis glycosyltransferase TuaC
MTTAPANSQQPLGVLVMASLWPNRRAPHQGMYNWQQFSALSQMARVALVAPVPFTQLWRREQGQPPRDPFPVQRPVFWYAPRLGRGLQGKLMLACAWSALRGLASRLGPQVFLANWAYPDGWAGIQAAHRLKLPSVLQLLGSDINFMASDPVRRPFILEAMDQTSLITTVSAPLRDKALEMGAPPEKVIVLPNGVDTDLFQPRDRTQSRLYLGLPLNRKLILFVGHLVPEKGPQIVLEVLAQLPDDVMLIMVGGGPLRRSLSEKVKSLGLADRVRFVGEVPHQRIPAFIAACDCLALPSLREGEPNAVLEALAAGRPVAASRVGGVPQLVVDGSQGHLCTAGDADDLARALRLTLNRKWGTKELAASVADRTWQASARRLLDILQQAAGA